MRIAAIEFAGVRRRSLGWRSVAWFLLLAFTLQSYVTQTHIHGAAQGVGGAAIVKLLSKAPAHGNSPSENSSTDCPYCQAIVHAGAFFMPVTPVPIPLAVWSERIAPSIMASNVDSASAHDWHSRAPPRR
jgi:hypothetical protein